MAGATTLIVLAGFAIGARDASILVSRASGAGGNGASEHPALSTDGRLVAFQSRSSNLVADDADSVSDVYVRDLATDTTSLISRASGADGVKGDGDSSEPSISADGRFVAFTSESDTLVPGVDGGQVPGGTVTHVFVRDLATDTTVVVDRASGASGEISTFGSNDPSISADGRFVAFTAASAVSLDPTVDGGDDVFVRDLATNTTLLISRASGEAGEAGKGSSVEPSISADGSRVAFTSFAENLAPGGAINPDFGAVFVRDLETQETILASRESGANGRVARIGASSPAISGNGGRVAFVTDGENLHPRDRHRTADVYVRDLETDRTLYASRGLKKSGRHVPGSALEPTVSGNGRLVAFPVRYDGPSTGFYFRASVRDLRKKTTRTVPNAITERVPDGPLMPTISVNGRWLGFQSELAGLDAGEDRIMNVFITRLSR